MKIIGITACPTETTHIYMAQGCLEKKCRKRGFDMKIGTQGDLEIENGLSKGDVTQADVVILAISVITEGEEQLENKRVLHTDVDEVISHMERLVDRAVALVEGN